MEQSIKGYTYDEFVNRFRAGYLDNILDKELINDIILYVEDAFVNSDDELNDRIDSLLDDIDDLGDEIGKLNDTIDDHKDQIDSLETELSDMKEERDNWIDLYNELIEKQGNQ